MNYKITFNIKYPMSFHHQIMFDDIVAHAYFQDTTEGANQSIQKLNYTKDELIDFSPMPIIKHKDGYFMSSWMFYDKENIVEYIGSWKKRWDNENDHLVDFAKRRRNIRINAAEFKHYSIPIRLVDIPKCWFYFQSNEVEEVQRLIETYIPGLGKKISQGNGFIESFEIEQIKDDPFKQIIRPIPTAKRGKNVKFTGYRPPYWHPDNQDHCLVQ